MYECIQASLRYKYVKLALLCICMQITLLPLRKTLYETGTLLCMGMTFHATHPHTHTHMHTLRLQERRVQLWARGVRSKGGAESAHGGMSLLLSPSGVIQLIVCLMIITSLSC